MRFSFNAQECGEQHITTGGPGKVVPQHRTVAAKYLCAEHAAHRVTQTFKIMGEPARKMPLEFIPVLRPLLQEPVWSNNQDVFAREALASFQQFQSLAFGEMLDHIEQGDEVERPAARALKDCLGTGAENVRQHIVIVLRSLASISDRAFECVQANRAQPRAELSQNRRGAATDIQRRMTVTSPSHLPDMIFNAMRGDESAKEVVCPTDHTLVGRTQAAASAFARQEGPAGLLDSYQARNLDNW